MELYISDHPLDCLTCPANGHCELQDMAGAVGLREVRYGYEGENHLDAPRRTSRNPVLHLRCQQVHRLLALRARLRRTAGNVRADDSGPRLRFQGRGEPERVVHGFRVRLLRRLRAGLPDRDAVGEVADREGPGRAQHHHHLRLLRRRLLVPRRDEGRGSRAHGAEQGRPRQSRPLLRQRPLRDRLCDAPGPHHQADDPRADLRSLARGVLGGGDRLRRLRVQAHPGQIRPRLHRRHHLLALHQRGDLPGAEAGARRLRQQQRRHLRARLPFADRLRPQEHHRRIRRHAELRFGHEGRRHLRHRRQSRPTGTRYSPRR